MVLRLHALLALVATGVWERVFKALSDDPDFEYVMIDRTICRVHQHGAGGKRGTQNQAIGRSRGGLTTKIGALVDALGNLIAFVLVPASVTMSISSTSS